MNKNVFIKFVISLFVSILAICTFYSPSSQAISDIISGGRDFISAGNNIESTINTTALSNTSSAIYNVLFGIAIIVAIIVAMILGIQFMIASVDEKAKVKEALIPFVVGCVIVFGSFTIWKVATNIGNSLEEKTTSVIKDGDVIRCNACGHILAPGEIEDRTCFTCGMSLTNLDK